MKFWRIFIICAGAILGTWLALEVGLRIFVESPLKTDFYSSITRQEVSLRQQETGLKLVQGTGWAHLAWIADPDNEVYIIEKYDGDGWLPVGQARFGSYLVRGAGGRYRVRALPADGSQARLIGEVEVASVKALASPVYRPEIAGKWQLLFKPQTYGYYINDHTVYRDAEGNWRLVGITHKSDGNYNEEKYFAVGVSNDLPPAGGMKEEKPVADFGDLAWAPHVITENGTYYMFWSPHRLERMTSGDGITWSDRETVIPAPYHKFFRDGMVIKVADGQWLLYATAKEALFSQVDIYQSFDLRKWQYIDTALRQVEHLPQQAHVQIDTSNPVDSRLSSSHDLSLREMEILQWVSIGKTNPEIGSILEISEFTVKNHMQRVFKKLDVSNRAQAVGKLNALISNG